MTTRLGRRALLRGAGGAALGLPFLSAMLRPGRTHAQPGAIPKRFVVMFSPCGTIHPRWVPQGGERDFELSEILAPLAPHRDDLVVLDGVDMVTAHERSGGRNGHDIGMGHCLVARPLLEGPSGFGEFGHLWDGSAGGISIDQEVALHLGEGARFRSLELGVKTGIRQAIPSRMSWRGPFEPAPSIDDPAVAFDRVFGAGVEDPGRVAAVQMQRRSVLDAVMGDYRRLSGRLGADDRRRLDAHLESIREVEQRIAMTAAPVACSAPERRESSEYPEIGRIHMDSMTLAMACELTPVSSLQWSNGQSGVRFDWLDIATSHHGLSHDGDSNAQSQDQLTAINRWYAEQLAYLLERMKSIEEADGQTLLDHSIVLWVNELGTGNTHTRRDMPYVLAGKAGGAIETGRFLRYDGDPHGNLFVSILNALGIEASTFGDPDFCTGPLSRL